MVAAANHGCVLLHKFNLFEEKGSTLTLNHSILKYASDTKNDNYLSDPFVVCLPAYEVNFWFHDDWTDANTWRSIQALHGSSLAQQIREVGDLKNADIAVRVTPEQDIFTRSW